jgi:hypothetical protein
MRWITFSTGAMARQVKKESHRLYERKNPWLTRWPIRPATRMVMVNQPTILDHHKAAGRLA